MCKKYAVEALVQPVDLDPEVYKLNMGAKMIWETSMKMFMKRVDQQETNLRAIYAIVWGQCSPMMQAKLESHVDFETKSDGCDCVWLLLEIQAITHKFEGTRNIFISLDDAWKNYYNFKQKPEQSLHDYLKDFQSVIQVLEHYDASVGIDTPYQKAVEKAAVVGMSAKATAEEKLVVIKAAAKKKCIAIAFLKRADRKLYGGLWSELENNFSRSFDQYPLDLTAAFNLLLNYKQSPAIQQKWRDREPNAANEEVGAVAFLQHGTAKPGTDGALHKDIKCFHCNKMGHYANACPQAE